jgi:cystathionine beta-lyase
MHYNFDEIIDRRNTACYKYDLRNKFFNNPDVLPMWVADMDFRTPDFVMNAIKTRLEHEILGYSFHTDSQFQSIIDWVYLRHQWKVKKEWIGFTPGVVPALNFTVLTFTNPGDKIIIQTPVYFPFYSAVTDHDRQLILNPLKLKNGRYSMDLENLKSQIDSGTKMLILCSPHNPTGNVWKKDELTELTEICLKNDILIISDEIHADIVYEGQKHIPAAMINEEVANQTITLMAPSKTFNFAGLSTSYFIASNNTLYDQMYKAVNKMHLGMGNIIGNIALEAAYGEGNEWLAQLMKYLQGNVKFTKDFINSNMPALKLIEPEATFLLWIDFRNTGLDDKTIRILLVEDAQIGLSNGILFGKDGRGFQRVNIGCPRSILEKGLRQIVRAIKKRQ